MVMIDRKMSMVRIMKNFVHTRCRNVHKHSEV